MIIERTSTLTGVTRHRDIDITDEQLLAYHEGALAQRAFPTLSDADREFIMTGITEEEWDDAFYGVEP